MKRGFTLSEILITLGVIGVVSAITMPVLVNKINNMIYVNRLKKAYSEISQVFAKISEDSEVNYTDFFIRSKYHSKIGSLQWHQKVFDDVFKPNIKITKLCVNKGGCFSKDTKTISGLAPYDFNKTQGGIGASDYVFTFITADGYSISIRANSFFSNTSAYKGRNGIRRPNDVQNIADNDLLYLLILVDVNGMAKPNIYGKDTFAMVYFPKLGVIAPGKDETISVVNANCNKSSNKNSAQEVAGYYCLSKIMRDGWKIKY